ncbi:MAG: efflux RND transporter periplasmic adaptor subunit [Opitutaceae bacterium]
MKKLYKVLLPIGIVCVAVGITVVLVKSKKKPETKPVEIKPTLVQVIPAESKTETFRVRTQGTVMPRTESTLTSEVSGRILSVSPAFYAGGVFETGDVLLEIDPSNYQSAVAQAEFTLEQARLRYAQEEARAEQARKEWGSLSTGKPSPLALREPQLQAEAANVEWAQAALDKARQDLDRTTIRAQFTGMVREKKADIGQYVTVGTPLGTVFAIDVAEVRLPISLDQLAYLDLPTSFQGKIKSQLAPPVTLTASFGGMEHTWNGTIVRTEGAIDLDSRMITCVAQVDDPYSVRHESTGMPLTIGLFVEAVIEGRTVDNVVVLPRQALRGSDRILVVDENNSLSTRNVEVIKADADEVIITEGLEVGELVCLTALEFVVEGMAVEAVSPDGSPLASNGAALAEVPESKGDRS